MDLGPSFLEHDNPELVAVCSREAGLTFQARDVVVHGNLLVHTVLVELDAPRTLLVDVIILEKFVDAFRELGKDGECGTEVAVADDALSDVVRRDAVLKHRQLAFIIVQLGYVRGADPLNVVPGNLATLDVRFDQRTFLRREILINVLVTTVGALLSDLGLGHIVCLNILDRLLVSSTIGLFLFVGGSGRDVFGFLGGVFHHIHSIFQVRLDSFLVGERIISAVGVI